jgi:hypothetical protein
MLDRWQFKKLFLNVSRNYALSFCVFWLGAGLLNPESQIITLLSVFLVHGWVYFVHIGLHKAHQYGIFNFLNTHMVYHHQTEKTIPRYLELFYETITDSIMNLSLYGFQKLVSIEIVPFYVILLFTLTYVSIHIINYSIIGSVFHRRHHDTLDKNLAPDAMDHLCGTNYNEEFEDLNPTCLNITAMMVLTSILKNYFL